MKMKNSFKIIIFYVVLIVAILWACSAFMNKHSDEITFSKIVNYFENEQVEKFFVDDDNVLHLTLKSEKEGDTKKVEKEYEV